MYALQDVPGRGKGLVAIDNIPRGTRILSEEPLITIPLRLPGNEEMEAHIYQQVNSLTEHQRQAFFSMPNLYPYENDAERSLGIYRTVGLPIEEDGIGGGIFLEAGRINHSCDNNAQKDWNENIKRHTVHALRDIPNGEEITVTYLGTESSRAIRQKKLQDKFGFLCSCRVCSLPAEQSREYDKKLERIDQLDDLIAQNGMRMNFSLQTLRYVDEQIRLYNEQIPCSPGLARAYLDAAQMAIANSDLARGSIFAERAVEGWRMAFGSDSKNVIQHGPLVQNPAKLSLYGLSSKWKTSLDEVPQGLDPNDFEDWLWKREKPKNLEHLGQLKDLRNYEIFPGFAALPGGKRIVDLDFYQEVNDIYQPRRNWCFLGEIIDSTILHHLELQLLDVDSKKIPLHFYTEGGGSEMASGNIQVGHTVAVLHAQCYQFQYGDPGIRHEDHKMLRIFPVSLKKLLELNDEVQQFSTEVDGMRACHGCNKKSPSLNRCAKCALFWYCDRDCQTKGWNERGHKGNCKLLRNPDLRALFMRGTWLTSLSS